MPRLPSKNQGRVNLYRFKPLRSNSFFSVPISSRYFPVCGSIRGSRSAEVAKYMVSVSTQVYISPSCHRYTLLRPEPEYTLLRLYPGTYCSVLIQVHITPSWTRIYITPSLSKYILLRPDPGTHYSVLIQVHIILSWSLYTLFCLDPGTHYSVFIQVHILLRPEPEYTLLCPEPGTHYSVFIQVHIIPSWSRYT